MNKVLRLEITDKCNLHCNMCWSKDWKHNDMTFEELKRIIIEYAELEPDGIVVLTSREPLLSINFKKVLELCTALNLDIKILTNCTLLNEEFCETIMNNNVSFISTSLHGTEEEHDKITGVKGSYRLTLNGIILLDKYRKKYNKDLDIRITTIFRKSLIKNLENILNIVMNNNLSLRIQHMMWHSNIEKTIHKNKIKELYSYDDDIIDGFPDCTDISGVEVLKIIKRIKSYDDKVNIQIYPNLEYEEILSWYDTDKRINTENYCDHAIESIRIRANGDIAFCQYIDKNFGNIKYNTLKELIYENDEYTNMCNDFLNGKLLPICLKCCHCRNKIKILKTDNSKI